MTKRARVEEEESAALDGIDPSEWDMPPSSGPAEVDSTTRDDAGADDAIDVPQPGEFFTVGKGGSLKSATLSAAALKRARDLLGREEESRTPLLKRDGNSAFKTPSTSTPTRKRASRGFSTPFKGGIRPEGLTPQGFRPKASAPTPTARRQAPLPPQRRTMEDAGIKPQSHWYEDLQSTLPSELLDMDLDRASVFRFANEPSDTDIAASRAWIENHRAMIIWKLASIIRSKPEEVTRWSYDEVARQLRARHEREQRGERSAVKRIQEQDSSAALPLILCVSRLVWQEQAIKQVELTDGWYRLHANLDAPLQRAAQRGKIVVGSKLHIVAARHQGDAADPLQSTGELTIAGNATTLTAWYARLGFVVGHGPPVVALRKITQDGGCVPLIAVRVHRIHPTGYTAKGAHEVWNASEEDERRAAYDARRDKARDKLGGDAQKTVEDYRAVVELLGSSCAGAADDFDAEEALDEVERSHASVGKLNAAQRGSCLKVALERLEQVRQSAYAELEAELDVRSTQDGVASCPKS